MNTLPTPRVLVVDDQPDFAQGLAMLLRVKGYEVEVAGDGETGLQFVRDHRPDVVLLDLGLPRVDGYEVARRIRAIDPAYTPRLVALTGYDLEEAAPDGIPLFDTHMLKPVDIRQLINYLRPMS